MAKKDIPAYSPTTNTHYPNWDALIQAESSGYVAVAIIDNGVEIWPWMVGPFATKREASNQAASLRRQARRGEFDRLKVKVFVRPAWKPNKERRNVRT